jgi:SulP family sulfate permease
MTNPASRLARLVPALDWGANYKGEDLPNDVMAGLITAIMLVPQSMAYAMLAGLPPQIGLYASMAPLVLYGIFGTSRALAVGPVAIVSLMTATALTAALPEGASSAQYVAAAAVLALLNGLVLLALGALRAGFLVNFLSHPVLSGFTSAAAFVIGLSQVRHLLGLSLPRSSTIETVTGLISNFTDLNPTTFALGVGAILLIVWMRGPLQRKLDARDISPFAVQLLTKSGPLVVVVIGTTLTLSLGLVDRSGIAIVGAIPLGLPDISAPLLDRSLWVSLLPSAALIGLVGYMESVSVAKALAARRRQKVDPNQELIGLGMANIAAGFTGAYPVTGGFSRSMVNFAAGARTPLASIITAALVGLSVALLTPLFHDLPRTILAAIILVAVASLIDLKSIRHSWQYSKSDGTAQIATIIVVLMVGIEAGILVGVGLSLILFLWRTSRPHMAVVGQVDYSEQYRNVLRHTVRTDPEILLLRVDENLYFANTAYLEARVQEIVSDNPEVSEIVLICSAVNFIDGSAFDTLEQLIDNFRQAEVTLHLAEVKGPVMDRLNRTKFVEHLAPGQVFSSTHEAVKHLREIVHADGFDPVI